MTKGNNVNQFFWFQRRRLIQTQCIERENLCEHEKADRDVIFVRCSRFRTATKKK